MCLAVPGEITRTYDKNGLRFAEVAFGGVSREVCLHYEPEATVGDFVLVHVGFAISRIDAEEAARTWKLLNELGQERDERDELARPSSPEAREA